MVTRDTIFRAWDSDHNRMWSHNDLLEIVVWEDVAVISYILEDIKDERGNDFHHSNGLPSYPGSDYITLMQYTGLKDKNGMEIYEGDIVTMPNATTHEADGSSHPILILVTWDEESACFVAGQHQILEYNFHMLRGTCEVIGNIYENKELLE